MSIIRVLCLLVLVAPAGFSQLTQDQKVADFLQLAGLYAKNYAPYQWKIEVFGFDLYDVQPWLDQVQNSPDDITFYDICVRYVASLQDSHDEVTLPSDFTADLHFTVDIYDGKVLIDSIDRSYLSAAAYPFQVGDQLVSLDGVAVADLIQQFIPYAVNGSGNPISQQRLAAGTITQREQDFYPMAHLIPATATAVILRQSGALETYTIPWDKQGTPITVIGPVPGIFASDVRQAPKVSRRKLENSSWGVSGAPPPSAANDQPYMQPLVELRNMSAIPSRLAFGGFGNMAPLFNPPPGFQLRLGAQATDLFTSGTFPVGGYTIGFIRIPTMLPASELTGQDQFSREIQWFQKNTGGLVVDIMDNGGGDACYAQSLAQYLIPQQFQGVMSQVLATQYWIENFSSSLTLAQSSGAQPWVNTLYADYLSELQAAMAVSRGMTGPLPLCGPTPQVGPATDWNGNSIAYTKPILVLTDNFTLSAAEIFAMMFQDAHRATIFGMRTDGGGGNPGTFDATTYSEGTTRVTRSLIVRAQVVQTPGFPASNYIENTGVYPDIVQDYMTADNLLNQGATFVAAFSSAIAGMVQ
jgi:hypothetical protein